MHLKEMEKLGEGEDFRHKAAENAWDSDECLQSPGLGRATATYGRPLKTNVGCAKAVSQILGCSSSTYVALRQSHLITSASHQIECGAGEMTQWVKVITTKPDDLSSIAETHSDGEN